MPILILAAHGTRSEVGLSTVRAFAAEVRAARTGLDVRECYVDVAAPTFAEVLSGADGPVVVVPLLLSGGYHVHVDIPTVINGRAQTRVTPALGPDRAVSRALALRLADARGWRPVAQEVVLVAAGSSDASARADVDAAAVDLAALLGRPVHAAVLTNAGRSIADVAAARGGATLEAANYLLADGFFADRLAAEAQASGITVIAAPLGTHPALVELVLARYDRAMDEESEPAAVDL